ncbi:MAG TPA: hypothetical protein VFY04_04185 [Solirubrobacterales bacterium]|nr:hypothetical protein [Solirubrobacterales bacterium]
MQVAVEQASAQQREWPAKAAAAVSAALEFAAANPKVAQILTNEALSSGPDGLARHDRLIGYAAGRLATGRALYPESSELPEIIERALVGGLVMLIAQRLTEGREGELPDAAGEMIEFVLTPFLGVAEARRVAAEGA